MTPSNNSRRATTLPDTPHICRSTARPTTTRLSNVVGSAWRRCGRTLKESRRLQSSTIQEAEALGRVHNLCHVLAYGGAFGSALRQEWTTMSDFAERLESVASEHVLPFWLAAVNMFRGIARASNAQDDADAFFSRGVDWYIANGVGFLLPSFRVLFASAKGVGGNDPRERNFSTHRWTTASAGFAPRCFDSSLERTATRED